MIFFIKLAYVNPNFGFLNNKNLNLGYSHLLCHRVYG